MTPQLRTPAPPEFAANERRHFERRWGFFAGIFLVYLVYALVDLWQHHSIAQRVLGLVLIALFSFEYVVVVPRGAFGGPVKYRVRAIAGMVLIVVLYAWACGGGAAAFAPYLAVTLVVLLPWRFAVPGAVALAVAATWLPQYVSSFDVRGLQWGVGAGTLFATLAVSVMCMFAGTQHQLNMAQDEIELLATEQERLRIARDLHDLLGHALTTVTLKAELASRLVERDPVRAAAEMNEVAELSRQSLADVRETVAGYREVSLVRELATAREVLQAAGIEAEMPAAAEDVPGDLRELFGWVVREGVTNAVRHSRAHHVSVRFEHRAIEVVNDGADDVGPSRPGHGLTGLTERAEAMGGAVRAGREGTAGFRLRVEVPA
jgi:two-component system sensor histidine kinase DesK